mgnify:CR=1 FL=1
MAVLLKNNTYKSHARAIDSVLKPSAEVPRPVPHDTRRDCLTFEAESNVSYSMADLTVIGGGEIVVFNRSAKLRPTWQGAASEGRGLPTIATVSSGLINIRANSLVEMSWSVFVRSTEGTNLWQTTIEMSDDNGASYTAADHPVRSYNYHTNLDVSVVSPPRKFQVITGDIWRIRLWTLSGGGANTAQVTADGTFFTIRSL